VLFPAKFSRFLLAPAGPAQQRIVAPLFMIVQVLVAKTDLEYPLRQQLRDAEAGLPVLPTILATRRHLFDVSSPPFDLLQQDLSAVA
jgi:hypothetical protein